MAHTSLTLLSHKASDVIWSNSGVGFQTERIQYRELVTWIMKTGKPDETVMELGGPWTVLLSRISMGFQSLEDRALKYSLSILAWNHEENIV